MLILLDFIIIIHTIGKIYHITQELYLFYNGT